MKQAPTGFMIAVLTALLPQRFPGGGRRIVFDDLGFAPALRKVIVLGSSPPALRHRVEQIVTCPEFAAALHEFQRS
jgi:hypothetical protein